MEHTFRLSATELDLACENTGQTAKLQGTRHCNASFDLFCLATDHVAKTPHSVDLARGLYWFAFRGVCALHFPQGQPLISQLGDSDALLVSVVIMERSPL